MKKITTIITLLAIMFSASVLAENSDAINADYVVSKGETILLDATTDNVYDYLWIQTNETSPVISINTETLTPGMYTYTVIATNEYGCESETSINVKVTAMETSEDTFSSIVYPNPTSGTINYDLVSLPENDYTVSLFSTSGDLVFTQERYSSESFSTGNVDLSSVAPGIYFLQFSGTEFQSVEKIILQ